MYLHSGQHEKAARCYERAVDLDPSNPDLLYNLATSRTAFGRIDEAEQLFTRVIEINPRDGAAWLNRSILRKRTGDDNHVAELKALLKQLAADDPGRIQICFALARELEDLQHYDEAFRFLQEGAHRRRLGMQYDIAQDETVMAEIARRFDRDLLGSTAGFPSNRPVFILGLPRSGTTLVDRILSSHSQVDSLGEHSSLPLAVMDLADGDPDSAAPATAFSRSSLIRRSTRIDFAELGRRYCQAIEGFGNPAPRLIDKTPLNFLYLGLIHLALPGAHVIHMRRHPLDSCYAMYKTMFRAGYPFSYSLQEVGRYYLAYHRLMEHWRQTIPERFLDVDYERVIADPEGETRRMLEYLGLDWEAGCLQFHRRSGAAATASAAQVRQPIYSSSVGMWRHYSTQLAPLAAKLRERGVDVDAS